MRKATCHPDRDVVARGLCRACYQREWKRRAPRPTCHPERRYHAAGLCSACYSALLETRGKRATCHPARRAKAHGLCVSCYRKKVKPWNTTRLNKYGLTSDDYLRALAQVGERCAICGDAPSPGYRLAVDHDHASGKYRGLLCVRCNAGLGNFRDDPARLLRAADYLRQHREIPA